jgi:GNAT superfamily N-acetyltransferase
MPAAAAEEGCRRAGSDDLPRLAEMADSAVRELQAGRGGAVWARTTPRQAPYDTALAAELTDPDRCVLVGTLDGTVMGYGVAHVEVLHDGGRLGIVDDLYTEPGCRELGIGELTMEALVDWCRAQGCFGVDSLALPGDRHTKNFFESFGLVARAIIVHRSLP